MKSAKWLGPEQLFLLVCQPIHFALQLDRDAETGERIRCARNDPQISKESRETGPQRRRDSTWDEQDTELGLRRVPDAQRVKRSQQFQVFAHP